MNSRPQPSGKRHCRLQSSVQQQQTEAGKGGKRLRSHESKDERTCVGIGSRGGSGGGSGGDGGSSSSGGAKRQKLVARLKVPPAAPSARTCVPSQLSGAGVSKAGSKAGAGVPKNGNGNVEGSARSAASSSQIVDLRISGDNLEELDEMESAGMMAAFQKAKLSALSGDEERRFIHLHPELLHVPADSRLYIIGRPHTNRVGKAHHYYLQNIHDEGAVSRYNTLKALVETELGVPYSRDQSLFQMWREFALQGEEEKEYLKTHPVLSRIPYTQRLHIIARPHVNRNGNQICFFLQSLEDENEIHHYRTLQHISSELDDGYHRDQQRFENALSFAMEGEGEQLYLDKHPVLARIPDAYKLFIIDRGSRRVSFWLQSETDTRVLKFYKSLQSLSVALQSRANGGELPPCSGRIQNKDRERERIRVRT